VILGETAVHENDCGLAPAPGVDDHEVAVGGVERAGTQLEVAAQLLPDGDLHGKLLAQLRVFAARGRQRRILRQDLRDFR
jgi:hypothetical protein